MRQTMTMRAIRAHTSHPDHWHHHYHDDQARQQQQPSRPDARRLGGSLKCLLLLLPGFLICGTWGELWHALWVAAIFCAWLDCWGCTYAVSLESREESVLEALFQQRCTLRINPLRARARPGMFR